jgi:hypothetical protein
MRLISALHGNIHETVCHSSGYEEAREYPKKQAETEEDFEFNFDEYK